ncbi:MAG: acylphosphatase [Ornithinimicrobium sp.]
MAERQDTTRAVIFVRGRVQNVGFRWWTRAQALELGLVGHARNLPDGRVEVMAQGTPENVQTLQRRLSPEAAAGDRPGTVEGITVQSHPVRHALTGFRER